MGDPETDHRGTESNVAAFVLRPTITNGPVIGAGGIVGMTSSTELVDGVTVQLRAGNLRLDFDPNVGKEQRVTLFLNQLNAGPGIRPRAYTFRAPAGNGVPDGSDDVTSVVIPFTRVVAGTYLVRTQVNGRREPARSGWDGGVCHTEGDARMSAAIAPAAVEPWWEANQRDLVGHLDRVRGLLEGDADAATSSAAVADERYALGRLVAAFGLTPVRARHRRALCGSMNSKAGSPRSSLTPPAQPRRRLMFMAVLVVVIGCIGIYALMDLRRHAPSA